MGKEQGVSRIGYTAIGISTAALICCGVFIPLIVNECQNVLDFLSRDMRDFRINESNIWKDIVNLSDSESKKFKRSVGPKEPEIIIAEKVSHEEYLKLVGEDKRNSIPVAVRTKRGWTDVRGKEGGGLPKKHVYEVLLVTDTPIITHPPYRVPETDNWVPVWGVLDHIGEDVRKPGRNEKVLTSDREQRRFGAPTFELDIGQPPSARPPATGLPKQRVHVKSNRGPSLPSPTQHFVPRVAFPPSQSPETPRVAAPRHHSLQRPSPPSPRLSPSQSSQRTGSNTARASTPQTRQNAPAPPTHNYQQPSRKTPPAYNFLTRSPSKGKKGNYVEYNTRTGEVKTLPGSQVGGSLPRPGVTVTESIQSTPQFPLCSQVCSAESSRKCPAGPRGDKGDSGELGFPGPDGQDGLPGVDAKDVFPRSRRNQPTQSTSSFPAFNEDNCFTCAPGEPGLKGNNGRPGRIGRRGQPGPLGRQGTNGRMGKYGDFGVPGTDGPDGYWGKPGSPGEDGVLYQSEAGRKGYPGPIGPMGDTGYSGVNYRNGPPGYRGLPGKPGNRGQSDNFGVQGPPGPPGRPGPAGAQTYAFLMCSCPSPKPSAYGDVRPTRKPYRLSRAQFLRKRQLLI